MRKYLLACLLSTIFFIGNLFILSDYGINWDSPLHYLRGQAYADVLLNQKTTWENTSEVSPTIIRPFTYGSRYYFAASETLAPDRVFLPSRPLPQQDYQEAMSKLNKRLSFYQHHAYSGDLFKEEDGVGHLPLISILSAFANRIFFGMLGWLGDLESYQIAPLFISSLGVFIVSLFAFELSGSWLAGLVAGLALALFPLFWVESHINLKDPEQAVFFAGAIWSFWHWLKSKKLGWFGLFGVFGGLALAVKWNIVFLPLILIPWLLLIRKTEEFKRWFEPKKLLIYLILFFILNSLFLILIWPYAWRKPEALLQLAGFYLNVGTGTTLIQPSGFIFLGFNLYPLVLFLTQTPEVILILGVVGVVWGIRRVREDKLKTGYLLLLWLLVPLIRVILPGARSYAGIRQIMEVLPVMAILAGIGGYYLINRIKQYELRIKLLIPLFLILYSLFLLFPLVQLHPNQNSYFNSLVGGLKGAKEKGLIDWTLTYGNIYKQAASWINKNAEMNTNIAHLSGSDFALSPLYLREDISISPDHFSGFEQKGEYIMALYNPLDPPVFAKRYPERFLNPVHVVEVDGVPLLFIYKNEAKYLKTSFKTSELKTVKMIPQTTDEADFWKVDLGKEYQVARIVVNGVGPECTEGVEQNEQVLSFGNEAIAFIPQSQALQPVDLTRAYVLNEKRVSGEGRVEYSFAGEEARFIYIYPQNNQSCFATGKIDKVFVME